MGFKSWSLSDEFDGGGMFTYVLVDNSREGEEGGVRLYKAPRQ